MASTQACLDKIKKRWPKPKIINKARPNKSQTANAARNRAEVTHQAIGTQGKRGLHETLGLKMCEDEATDERSRLPRIRSWSLST